jgi:hypothetical protein
MKQKADSLKNNKIDKPQQIWLKWGGKMKLIKLETEKGW